MNTQFVATPVSIDFRRGSAEGEMPALLLVDVNGKVVLDFPTPGVPQGNPLLDPIAFATMNDLSRQFNELHAYLVSEAAAATPQLPHGMNLVPGIECTTFDQRGVQALGDWRIAVELQSQDGKVLYQAARPVDGIRYGKDAESAREAITEALSRAQAISAQKSARGSRSR